MSSEIYHIFVHNCVRQDRKSHAVITKVDIVRERDTQIKEAKLSTTTTNDYATLDPFFFQSKQPNNLINIGTNPENKRNLKLD